MEYIPNNTFVYPPEHRRRWWEIGLLLFVGVAIPIILLAFFIETVVVPMSVPSTIPPEDEVMAPPANVSPISVSVELVYPPTETPGAKVVAVATSTPGTDYCDPRFTKGGETCTKPDPPPPPPTPLPGCFDPGVTPGRRCVWPEPVGVNPWE